MITPVPALPPPVAVAGLPAPPRAPFAPPLPPALQAQAHAMAAPASAPRPPPRAAPLQTSTRASAAIAAPATIGSARAAEPVGNVSLLGGAAGRSLPPPVPVAATLYGAGR
jgi:hypothetical protein